MFFYVFNAIAMTNNVVSLAASFGAVKVGNGDHGCSV